MGSLSIQERDHERRCDRNIGVNRLPVSLFQVDTAYITAATSGAGFVSTSPRNALLEAAGIGPGAGGAMSTGIQLMSHNQPPLSIAAAAPRGSESAASSSTLLDSLLGTSRTHAGIDGRSGAAQSLMNQPAPRQSVLLPTGSALSFRQQVQHLSPSLNPLQTATALSPVATVGYGADQDIPPVQPSPRGSGGGATTDEQRRELLLALIGQGGRKAPQQDEQQQQW